MSQVFVTLFLYAEKFHKKNLKIFPISSPLPPKKNFKNQKKDFFLMKNKEKETIILISVQKNTVI
jgi:hypothetical protein